MLQVIQFIALFLLLLVTGVFWGLWFSLSRSYHVFSVQELQHIARTIISNLAVPMRFISFSCLLLMSLSAWFSSNREFYFTIVSIAFILMALLITVVIEVPINNQVIAWTELTVPSDWESIRNRWQFFNVIRTFAALAGFGFFAAAILF